jgi:hypothetical protein
MEAIIENNWGGLGDWLSISTLPEELFKQKGITTYLNAASVFRNKEIKDLILLNPFIKGEKKGSTNIGDVPGKTPEYKNLVNNHIKNWELLHGLEPVNNFAKIYYEPKIKDEYKDIVVVDLTSITEQYDNDKVQQAVAYIKNKKFKTLAIKNLSFKNKLNDAKNDKFHGGRHVDYLVEKNQEEKISISSIFEYCDILASCHGFISLHSGSHTLASTIKNQFNNKLNNFCIIRKHNYDNCVKNSLYVFSNVEYIAIEG